MVAATMASPSGLRVNSCSAVRHVEPSVAIDTRDADAKRTRFLTTSPSIMVDLNSVGLITVDRRADSTPIGALTR